MISKTLKLLKGRLQGHVIMIVLLTVSVCGSSSTSKLPSKLSTSSLNNRPKLDKIKVYTLEIVVNGSESISTVPSKTSSESTEFVLSDGISDSLHNSEPPTPIDTTPMENVAEEEYAPKRSFDTSPQLYWYYVKGVNSDQVQGPCSIVELSELYNRRILELHSTLIAPVAQHNMITDPTTWNTLGDLIESNPMTVAQLDEIPPQDYLKEYAPSPQYNDYPPSGSDNVEINNNQYHEMNAFDNQHHQVNPAALDHHFHEEESTEFDIPYSDLYRTDNSGEAWHQHEPAGPGNYDIDYSGYHRPQSPASVMLRKTGDRFKLLSAQLAPLVKRTGVRAHHHFDKLKQGSVALSERMTKKGTRQAARHWKNMQNFQWPAKRSTDKEQEALSPLQASTATDVFPIHKKHADHTPQNNLLSRSSEFQQERDGGVEKVPMRSVRKERDNERMSRNSFQQHQYHPISQRPPSSSPKATSRVSGINYSVNIDDSEQEFTNNKSTGGSSGVIYTAKENRPHLPQCTNRNKSVLSKAVGIGFQLPFLRQHRHSVNSFRHCYQVDKVASLLLPVNIVLVSVLHIIKPFVIMYWFTHTCSVISKVSSEQSSYPHIPDMMHSSLSTSGVGNVERVNEDDLLNDALFHEKSSDVLFSTLITLKQLVSKLLSVEYQNMITHASSHLDSAHKSSWIMNKIIPLLGFLKHQRKEADIFENSIHKSVNEKVLIESIFRQFVVLWVLLFKEVALCWDSIFNGIGQLPHTSMDALLSVVRRMVTPTVVMGIYYLLIFTLESGQQLLSSRLQARSSRHMRLWLKDGVFLLKMTNDATTTSSVTSRTTIPSPYINTSKNNNKKQKKQSELLKAMGTLDEEPYIQELSDTPFRHLTALSHNGAALLCVLFSAIFLPIITSVVANVAHKTDNSLSFDILDSISKGFSLSAVKQQTGMILAQSVLFTLTFLTTVKAITSRILFKAFALMSLPQLNFNMKEWLELSTSFDNEYSLGKIRDKVIAIYQTCIVDSQEHFLQWLLQQCGGLVESTVVVNSDGNKKVLSWKLARLMSLNTLSSVMIATLLSVILLTPCLSGLSFDLPKIDTLNVRSNLLKQQILSIHYDNSERSMEAHQFGNLAQLIDNWKSQQNQYMKNGDVAAVAENGEKTNQFQEGTTLFEDRNPLKQARVVISALFIKPIQLSVALVLFSVRLLRENLLSLLVRAIQSTLWLFTISQVWNQVLGQIFLMKEKMSSSSSFGLIHRLSLLQHGLCMVMLSQLMLASLDALLWFAYTYRDAIHLNNKSKVLHDFKHCIEECEVLVMDSSTAYSQAKDGIPSLVMSNRESVVDSVGLELSKVHIKDKKGNYIIHNLSCHIKPGQLTVIVGGSAEARTALLESISSSQHHLLPDAERGVKEGCMKLHSVDRYQFSDAHWLGNLVHVSNKGSTSLHLDKQSVDQNQILSHILSSTKVSSTSTSQTLISSHQKDIALKSLAMVGLENIVSSPSLAMIHVDQHTAKLLDIASGVAVLLEEEIRVSGKLLMFDDPASAFQDEESEVRFMSSLMRTTEQSRQGNQYHDKSTRGSIVLMTSSSARTALFAHHVIVLDSLGRLAEQGPPEYLSKNNRGGALNQLLERSENPESKTS